MTVYFSATVRIFLKNLIFAVFFSSSMTLGEINSQNWDFTHSDYTTLDVMYEIVIK
jgi:hypothetical protein